MMNLEETLKAYSGTRTATSGCATNTGKPSTSSGTDGILIERYVPEGTSLLGTTPQPEGTYGAETLPAVYSSRRANRGFEAIAYDPDAHVVYAFIQSPLENPDNSVRNNTDVIRILGVDAGSGTPVEEYVYLLERNQYSGTVPPPAWIRSATPFMRAAANSWSWSATPKFSACPKAKVHL
ncbi:MAG: esterase-like activity of phytase family protein [Lewinellaceae bacterium]|nr:esterase-like activity of phytase family protein [Lewinellaceae bacterium]